MSKQICIAAGGELKLKSQLMIGSSFSFKMTVRKLPQNDEENEVLATDSPVSLLLPPITKPVNSLLKN